MPLEEWTDEEMDEKKLKEFADIKSCATALKAIVDKNKPTKSQNIN